MCRATVSPVASRSARHAMPRRRPLSSSVRGWSPEDRKYPLSATCTYPSAAATSARAWNVSCSCPTPVSPMSTT